MMRMKYKFKERDNLKQFNDKCLKIFKFKKV